MKLTYKKLILSGPTIEEYTYSQKPLSYDFEIPEQSRSRAKIQVVDDESKKRKEESQLKSLHRTKSILRRLVNTNAWHWFKDDGISYLPVFLTFTFRENIQDIKEANRIFSKFIKRLNYFVGNKKSILKYIVVIEFQKRGAIHYHTIFFNLKFVSKDILSKLWRYGFIRIKAIEDVDNTGAYISKYMSKDIQDSRLEGRKRYFSSRGLHKPIDIKEYQKALKVGRLIPKKYLVNEKEFESAYNGKVRYRQFKLNKKQTLFNIIPDLNELL